MVLYQSSELTLSTNLDHYNSQDSFFFFYIGNTEYQWKTASWFWITFLKINIYLFYVCVLGSQNCGNPFTIWVIRLVQLGGRHLCLLIHLTSPVMDFQGAFPSPSLLDCPLCERGLVFVYHVLVSVGISSLRFNWRHVG